MSGKGRLDRSKQSIPDQHLLKLESNPQARHSQQLLSSARSYADLNYLFGSQDITMLGPIPKPNRRKSSQGTEHVKHRRTRSGCYTCRSRRVKCDEHHPKCDRCTKGNRECVYPDVQNSAKGAGNNSSKVGHPKPSESPGSSEDEYEDQEVERLEVIQDEDEIESQTERPENGWNTNAAAPNSHPTMRTKSSTRQSSETPSLIQDKGSSPTPSTEGSIGYSSFDQAGAGSQFEEETFANDLESGKLRSSWSHLPADLQFYLTYYCQNITFMHYSLRSNHEGFIHTLLLDVALRSEPLLYAVVGFSAFQYAVEKREGKIQDFLQYYNKAVSLLLKSLRKGIRHTTATLLAILQLATIEEYLGDWANLLGHQKAAYEILIDLYTPQTIFETGIGHALFGWYARFDVMAGIMGGFDASIPREWFSCSQEYFKNQIAMHPNSLVWRIEHQISAVRLIGRDMSTLFAKKGKGEITHEQFIVENAEMTQRMEDLIDPTLLDSRFLVMDFSPTKKQARGLFDPYIPGVLYSGALSLINLTLMDWRAMSLMHGLHTAQAMQALPDIEHMSQLSTDFCQLYEAILHHPEIPKGAAVGLQGGLGIAAFFLPKDEAHTMWMRRKLATIESQGFIQTFAFRSKMAELFRDNSCMHWWLPNDEMYHPIIRSIRKFVEDRTSLPKNSESKDVQDMKAVFSAMDVSDQSDSSPQMTSKGKSIATEVDVASNSGWSPAQTSMGYSQDEYGGSSTNEQSTWEDHAGAYK
ncbi:hypothetical protein sscle_01g001120 [Sclerotinia sclerotiorum 1980 UF-70]|uniref:Zn(2)-C6 fungal-type domain-containing protein n=1 Tax=Sclerotinia sclerotiorum (strain ATCC 18683 / 1980 / Ss-1) TaxID=665079 RepID=A0A1D9PS47_SCLS1|nr:hypothetical protein sscle_01g001120 [Sclerotinia sclerotiorum 1980 UF-70]